MRLPEREYTERAWRLHEIAPDFAVEDVWSLPTPGEPDELDRFVQGFTAGDEDDAGMVYRALFAVRWWIGRRLGWDRPDPAGGATTPSLRSRLPRDLAEGRRGPDFATVPLVAVYQTDREYVAEIVNRTVHGLMHIGWVPDPGSGTHHGVMTVLVRPRGRLGALYLSAINPIRRTIIYPSLLRAIGREWPRYPRVELSDGS